MIKNFFCYGGGVLMALAMPLCAENSGLFLGVSYQIGSASFFQESKTQVQGISETTSNKVETTKPEDGAGIKLGYKQFFGNSKWFGLRYYAFLDYGYADFGTLKGKDRHSHMFNYGVGADTLWQVFDFPNISFGFFCGGSVGADSWIGNGNYTNFQALVDAGLRTNLYKHHGFEVGVKVPFSQNKNFKTTKNSSYANTIEENRTNVRYNSSFYASYFYTF
ncbi:hypothetical protein BKH41_07525 [Helicobacter sp. 12S02232-10]|uniref:outer membrane protein n=1 Tax=Helicobacter sp. 12S02232-10 TaxID=1476197 RepID=UPI000BA5FB23|nr:outer membrane protein [Helicobacter sp. 12S02232-10]PAF47422.1 hypothetical protein BKH41_07525 [Helicobacter sp. 12S02232-10]